jgi:hypothetical protein
MKLWIDSEVFKLLELEAKRFRIKEICLIPCYLDESKTEPFLGLSSREEVIQQTQDGVIELNAEDIKIWIQVRYRSELDGKLLVRGQGGFKAVLSNGDTSSSAKLFVDTYA